MGSTAKSLAMVGAAAIAVAAAVVMIVLGPGRREGQGLPGAGASVLVRVIPPEGTDFFADGRLNLSYAFSRVATSLVRGDLPDDGNTVWIVLREKDGFFEPVSMSRELPKDLAPGDAVLRGTVDPWLRVRSGDIGRYDLPAGTPAPNPRDLTVRLSIDGDHVPRIEKLFVKGQPWP